MNYVRNVLVIDGMENDVEEVCNFLCSETQIVDFNKILPTPDMSESEQVFWQKNAWGCTNAVDCIKNKKNILSFSTALAPPYKAMRLLAMKFPEAEIKFWWSDEEKGYNSGMVAWSGGKIVEDIIPFDNSKASDDIYYYCWNTLREGKYA